MNSDFFAKIDKFHSSDEKYKNKKQEIEIKREDFVCS